MMLQRKKVKLIDQCITIIGAYLHKTCLLITPSWKLIMFFLWSMKNTWVLKYEHLFIRCYSNGGSHSHINFGYFSRSTYTSRPHVFFFFNTYNFVLEWFWNVSKHLTVLIYICECLRVKLELEFTTKTTPEHKVGHC